MYVAYYVRIPRLRHEVITYEGNRLQCLRKERSRALFEAITPCFVKMQGDITV